MLVKMGMEVLSNTWNCRENLSSDEKQAEEFVSTFREFIQIIATRVRNFTQQEKVILKELWESGELRGTGKYYSLALERTATRLGRSVPKIQASELELACIIIVNLLQFCIHSHINAWLGVCNSITKKGKKQRREKEKQRTGKGELII